MTKKSQAVIALLSYTQADAEGVFVLVSRQAIHAVVEELAQARAETLLELLQVFNDYDVPLTMTAEQVRDILQDFLTKKD